ncbi:TPA: hypothetical protein ACID9U_001238 [Pseudomonas aeruginosa]|uniref:hypothetical protein n=1 Tax=Pseudomonas aeruginosa TaxID=287 RepID=UPI0018C672FA|nr:hypothetical protein [Pseudomonas aeruginosa]EKI2989564.1 hypothetical protein [Pseudomonas aeruginosa]EKV5566716.1 hypothetical protein [Pseudomonas aeruginosa]ELJ2627136.1 hypothetical protein [Pseudomonas aeruginosa]MBG4963576.1 hypothetical protein [Pseudomonas aeruginosa]MBH8631200.1 hypothetical protein [Pseudomonas aeruginosa]
MYDRIEKDIYESPAGWSLFPLPAVGRVALLGHRLQEIHSLVLDIIKSEGPAFAFASSNGVEKLEVSRIGERLYSLRDSGDLLGGLEYSEHVSAFLACWKGLDMAGVRDWGLGPSQPSRAAIDALNKLLQAVRQECTSASFRNRLRIRRERAKKNAVRVERYVSKLLAPGDVLVLRMELGYLDPQLTWPSDNAVRLLAGDMRRFVNRLSKRTGLFRNLTGHVAFLGAGIEKRDFYHVVFVFDASESRDVSLMVNEIGLFWQGLVSNQQGRRGVFLDCRHSANDFRRRGIGRIGAKDAQLKKELRQGLYYLAKCSEYIRLPSHRSMRSMAMSSLRKRVEQASKASVEEAKKLGI